MNARTRVEWLTLAEAGQLTTPSGQTLNEWARQYRRDTRHVITDLDRMVRRYGVHTPLSTQRPRQHEYESTFDVEDGRHRFAAFRRYHHEGNYVTIPVERWC